MDSNERISRPPPPTLGPYELVERIATGGMAEVYLARREGPFGFQKTVALKRILPQLTCDTDFVSMFIDEARVCARLTHPNIVQVFDFGEHEGELYMAMEYVEGTTGAKLIRAAVARGEVIPLEVVLHLGLSILRALDYAHHRVDEEGQPLRLVHRDVSPGNLLIDRNGAVKLTDFGIARAAEFERRTDAGQLKGKLGYMSPEQVTGEELDGRSDLFTAAIVLAELITLRPLFAGGSEIEVLLRIRDGDLTAIDRSAHRVPEDLRPVLFKALSRDRSHRFNTASEFAAAIEQIARRRRLHVGPDAMAAFVERLGLSGTTAPRESGRMRSEFPAGDLRRTGRLSWSPQATPQEVSPDVYRVKMRDNSIVGPLSYPRLVELFVTGQVNADALVSKESGPFKMARGYPELQRFVSSSALRWDDEIPRAADDRAAVSADTLPAKLFALALRRDTGALLLQDGLRRKKIFFVEGIPEFVASTERTELLGELLVARGNVLRMEVDMALAMLPRFGGHLGDALVGLGVLRPIELFRAISEQTQERFAELMRWRSGEMAFLRGARSHEETFPLGIDTVPLIARGVREHYTVEELRKILEPLESSRLSPIVPLPIRLEAFRFSSREERVLRRVDGSATVGELIDSMAQVRVAEPDETRRAIFLGLSFEVISCPAWSKHNSDIPIPDAESA